MNMNTLFLLVNSMIIILSIIMMFKIVRTLIVRSNIRNAITLYRLNCYANDKVPVVTFDDMEGYYRTLFRFFDWGYSNVLSTEHYSLIRGCLYHVTCRLRTNNIK